MRPRVLLVEPDSENRDALAAPMATIAELDVHAEFSTARVSLSTMRYDLLVTNIRLGQYNGLHLVYIARERGTRCVVYEDHTDPFTAREAQSAGAFYESRQRLPIALPNYLLRVLPTVDRRNPGIADRRVTPRGGRRCTDPPTPPPT